MRRGRRGKLRLRLELRSTSSMRLHHSITPSLHYPLPITSCFCPGRIQNRPLWEAFSLDMPKSS